MARGIYIRESDLEPLIAVLAICTMPGKVGMRFPEREALDTLLSQVVDARASTSEQDIEWDRRLRYEFGDDHPALMAASRDLTGAPE